MHCLTYIESNFIENKKGSLDLQMNPVWESEATSIFYIDWTLNENAKVTEDIGAIVRVNWRLY